MKQLTVSRRTTTAMNTITLLLGVTLFVTTAQGDQPSPAESLVTPSPVFTNTIKRVMTVALPGEASIPQKESVITLTVAGQKTNLPVELFAFRHQYGRSPESNHWSFAQYEFQVRAKGGQPFVWSCWTPPDISRPHRFQLLTTESGRSYACYVREGVHLFHVSQSRELVSLGREPAPEDFEGDHPDALPRLAMGTLRDALGTLNVEGLGPQMWNVTVDSVSDSAGELRVTLHGAALQPQCTFALRMDKWALVSCSGK